MNGITIWEQDAQLQSVKDLFAKNLTADEFVTFVGIGKSTGLNPFLREIWAVKYGNSPANIFIGRDGYRKSAQSHKEYDYHSVDAVYSNDDFKVVDGEVKHSYKLTERGDLVGAYCNVRRKNSSKPCYTFVELKEYDTKQSVWKTKPATMIKKVAEAQGLRGAFQELFAGTYEESENWNTEKNEKPDLMDYIQRIQDEDDINSLVVTWKEFCTHAWSTKQKKWAEEEKEKKKAELDGSDYIPKT